MHKPDARLLNPTTQDYLRQQAIRLRQQGKPFVDIAAYLGVHRNTVSDWWQQYQQAGESALHQQPRGRKVGEGRTLTKEQEQQIQQWMLSHFPDEFEIDSALWTRRAVQQLIEHQFGVHMPIRTVGAYLWRWGYSPQKPLKRAYEQDPEAVEELTEAIFLKFLNRLIAKRTRKLFWIVDRHPVHRGQQVQQWLAQHQDHIELFYLPSYSPELNPTEYLNGDVKQGVHSKPPTRNLAQLKQRLIAHLRKLQKLPARVQKYFEHPAIAYASNKMQSLLLLS